MSFGAVGLIIYGGSTPDMFFCVVILQDLSRHVYIKKQGQQKISLKIILHFIFFKWTVVSLR